MPKSSSFIIKTRQTNGITEQFARLVGYEPYPDGRFLQVGDNGVKCLYRPLIDENGYEGVCPVEFNPYENGSDAMQVAAYLRAFICVSADGKQVSVATNDFEAVADLPQNKSYMQQHAKIMRDTIMAVAAMYVKKHFDIDPPVNTTTRSETHEPTAAPHVKTYIKE
jgi:hypothetical protein